MINSTGSFFPTAIKNPSTTMPGRLGCNPDFSEKVRAIAKEALSQGSSYKSPELVGKRKCFCLSCLRSGEKKEKSPTREETDFPFPKHSSSNFSSQSTPQVGMIFEDDEEKKDSPKKRTFPSLKMPKGVGGTPKSRRKEELEKTNFFTHSLDDFQDYHICKGGPQIIFRSLFPGTSPNFKKMKIGKFSVSLNLFHLSSYLFNGEAPVDTIRMIYDLSKSAGEKGENKQIPLIFEDCNLSKREELSEPVYVEYVEIVNHLYLFAEKIGSQYIAGNSIHGKAEREVILDEAEQLFHQLESSEVTTEFILFYSLSNEIKKIVRCESCNVSALSFGSKIDKEEACHFIDEMTTAAFKRHKTSCEKLTEANIATIFDILKAEASKKEINFDCFFQLLNMLCTCGTEAMKVDDLKLYYYFFQEIGSFSNLTHMFKLFCDLTRYFQVLESIFLTGAYDKDSIKVEILLNPLDNDVLEKAKTGQFCWILESVAYLRATLQPEEKHDFNELYELVSLMSEKRHLIPDGDRFDGLIELAKEVCNWPRRVDDAIFNEAKKLLEGLSGDLGELKVRYMGEKNKKNDCYPKGYKLQEKWIKELFPFSEYRILNTWPFDTDKIIQADLSSKYPKLFHRSLDNEKRTFFVKGDKSETEGTDYAFAVNDELGIALTKRHYKIFRPKEENPQGEGTPVGKVSVETKWALPVEELISDQTEHWNAGYSFTKLSFDEGANKISPREQTAIKNYLEGIKCSSTERYLK